MKILKTIPLIFGFFLLLTPFVFAQSPSDSASNEATFENQGTFSQRKLEEALEQQTEKARIAQLEITRIQTEAMKHEKNANYYFYAFIITIILFLIANGILLRQRFKLIQREKQKIEKLLLNTFPKSIVFQLKEAGKAKMLKYERVTTLFTDFKGFSEITKNMSGSQMMDELNDCFTNFDNIIQKYNVYRIKTIGDSYMCVGGLPDSNYTNPIDTILAGLEMQRFMEQRYAERNGEYWQCRLGINTGTARAGVVGISKFAYDVWGNSVNTASRLESKGEVNKVNINDETYELVKDFFDCEYRGELTVKHGVIIPMYFVNQIKAELSENGEGISPNEAFQEKLNDFKRKAQQEIKELEKQEYETEVKGLQ